MKLHLYYCEWKLCVGQLSLYLPGSSGWIRLWIAESGRVLGPPESLPLLPPLPHWPWCCTRKGQTNDVTCCHRGFVLIHYPTNFVWKPPVLDRASWQGWTPAIHTHLQSIYLSPKSTASDHRCNLKGLCNTKTPRKNVLAAWGTQTRTYS